MCTIIWHIVSANYIIAFKVNSKGVYSYCMRSISTHLAKITEHNMKCAVSHASLNDDTIRD